MNKRFIPGMALSASLLLALSGAVSAQGMNDSSSGSNSGGTGDSTGGSSGGGM